MTDDQNNLLHFRLKGPLQPVKPTIPSVQIGTESLLQQAIEDELKANLLLTENNLKESELHFVKASQSYLEIGQLECYLRNQLMYVTISHNFEYRNNLVAVQELQELELIAEQNNILRALGLIKKVKSCLLFDTKNIESALFEIEQAERLLSTFGATETQTQKIGSSWVQQELFLAKVQKCDCLIEVGEREKAKELFTELSLEIKEQPQKDKNDEFRAAFEYLNLRLGIKKSSEVLFDEKSPLYWIKKLFQVSRTEMKETIETLTWFTKTGHFLDPRKRIYGQIKVSSFEGRLIQYLCSQAGSKDEICSHLWPEEPKSDLLRTRFHSLVKRINYKIRDFVLYDGETYHLGKKIKLKI